MVLQTGIIKTQTTAQCLNTSIWKSIGEHLWLISEIKLPIFNESSWWLYVAAVHDIHTIHLPNAGNNHWGQVKLQWGLLIFTLGLWKASGWGLEIPKTNFVDCCTHISMVSCQKGPTCHAYAWQIGPFWQDTLDIWHMNSLHSMISWSNFVIRTVSTDGLKLWSSRGAFQ